MNNIDVLSIGDVVIDHFIKLIDNNAEIINREDKQLLAMEYGTKIPFDHAQVLEGVGNSPNAAHCFAKLGLNTALQTNVGSDSYGRDIIRHLDDSNINTSFVRINHGKKTNYHFVLWYKVERTILIKHEQYDYHWPSFSVNELPKWVYLSSVSENSLDYHIKISEWLNRHPEIKLAFQPGTFQMEFGVEKLRDIYQKTQVLILNREEAVKVGGGNHAEINDLFDKLHQIGPKIVVITDGPNGAYASDGENRYKMPIYPDTAPPFERTGAGDAFASTFVAALAKGEEITEALTWAPINSMSVVQKMGAQAGLLSERELLEYLKKAPEWYHPTKI